MSDDNIYNSTILFEKAANTLQTHQNLIHILHSNTVDDLIGVAIIAKTLLENETPCVIESISSESLYVPEFENRLFVLLGNEAYDILNSKLSGHPHAILISEFNNDYTYNKHHLYLKVNSKLDSFFSVSSICFSICSMLYNSEQSLVPLIIIASYIRDDLELSSQTSINTEIKNYCDIAKGKTLKVTDGISFLGMNFQSIIDTLVSGHLPMLKGLTGDVDAIQRFLHSINIDMSVKEKNMAFLDLPEDKIKKVINKLLVELNPFIQSHQQKLSFIRQKIEVLQEEEHLVTRNLRDFSQLVLDVWFSNVHSTILPVLLGEREENLRIAKSMFKEKRFLLVENFQLVKSLKHTIQSITALSFLHINKVISIDIIQRLLLLCRLNDLFPKDTVFALFIKEKNSNCAGFINPFKLPQFSIKDFTEAIFLENPSIDLVELNQSVAVIKLKDPKVAIDSINTYVSLNS